MEHSEENDHKDHTPPYIILKPTHMRKHLLITIGCIVLLTIALFFGRTSLASSASREVSAKAQLEAQYPPRAVQLGNWIDEQSLKYDAAEKALEVATQEKQDAENAASGYRLALCSEFHLQKGSGNAHILYFTNASADDCARFQLGEQPAQ